MSFKVEFKKLRTVEIDTKIMEAVLPKPTDVNAWSLAIKDSWWTNEGHPSYGTTGYAEYTTDHAGCTRYWATNNLNTIRGVRPLITIKPTGEITTGEHLLIGGRWLFVMTDPTHAICCTVIGYSQFSDGLCTQLEDSLVVKYINKWFDDIKNYPVYAAYTEKTDPNYFYIQDDDISLPPTSVGAFLDNAAYPFWTRNIVDNFTGKILVRKGDLREAELFRTKTSHGEFINICPCFKLPYPILNKDDMFVFDGRVFSVVYSNEAMCLNSVGVSCYSTGFFEPPDNNSLSDAIRAEEEFWKSSEAYETLTKWAIAHQV